MPLAGGSGESDRARALALAMAILKDFDRYKDTDLALLASVLVRSLGPRRDPDPTAAARARKYRRRSSQGALFTPIDLPPDLVEIMIDVGRLSDDASFDRNQRAEAVVTALRDFLRSANTA